MYSFVGKLTYGFVSPKGATSGYAALTDAEKIVFKKQFYTNARAILDNNFEPSTLASWKAFTLYINDPDGHMPLADVDAALNSKLAVDLKPGAPNTFTVDAESRSDVRYVYIDGKRVCEHDYIMLLDGTPWQISALGITEQVVFILSWESPATT